MIKPGTLCLIVDAPPLTGMVVTVVGPLETFAGADWTTNAPLPYDSAYPVDVWNSEDEQLYVEPRYLRPLSDPDADVRDSTSRDHKVPVAA